MNSNPKHAIVVVSDDEALRQRIEKFLAATELDVTFFSSASFLSDDGARDLAEPAVFIYGLENEDAPWKAVFEKAEDLFSETQRMVIIPPDAFDTTLAIFEKSGINFCLFYNFGKEDLFKLLKHCLYQYDKIRKEVELKKRINRQNRQMYQIARKFKQKHERFKNEIQEKQKKLGSLKSGVEKPEQTSGGIEFESLKEVLFEKDVPLSPEGFLDEFKDMAGKVGQVFREIAEKSGNDFEDRDWARISAEKDHAGQADSETVREIVNTVLLHVFNSAESGADYEGETVAEASVPERISVVRGERTLLDDDLEISVSEDGFKAFLSAQPEREGADEPDLTDVKEFISDKGISYGLIDDHTLSAWLSKMDTEARLVVAKGDPPEPSENGSVVYHFQTDYKQAGALAEDGRMDFKERGNVPFVEKGTLLAEKKRPAYGKPGVNVYGEEIPVHEPEDPLFTAGSDARLSDDELKIYADADGMPHLDAMGTVSVCRELNIDGDVDYGTGNINFKGNVVVKGTIKEGFRVKGTNLTADQIEGADIELSGDLTVTSGVVDATISAQGEIQIVKYINKSKIATFGNVAVSKEIIDSDIIVSGECRIESGKIIASSIAAKRGVTAGQVGTNASVPSKIKIGIDEYIRRLKKEVSEALEKNREETAELQKEIERLEKEDQEYYDRVTKYAHIQDRAQLGIKDLKGKRAGAEKSGASAEIRKIDAGIRELEARANDAEKQINGFFKIQDGIAEKTARARKRIEEIEEQDKALVERRKGLSEISEKQEPLARMVVNKKVLSGTRIEGPNSSLTVKENTSRCRIEEVPKGEEGVVTHYVMEVLPSR